MGEQKSSLTSPVAALSNPGWTAAVGMILGETARASNVDLSTPVPVLKHLPYLNDCEFIPFNHTSMSCSSPLGPQRWYTAILDIRLQRTVNASAVLSYFDHTLGYMFAGLVCNLRPM